MKITPQDIIDKEFRVKFRGFDMVEVDNFLNEVAENFYKLTEENALLSEKVEALQKDMAAGGRILPQGQLELPAELGNFLEELKQDTGAITAELVSLKQDRSTFASLERNIKEAVASLQKAAAIAPAQGQLELPVDLENVLEEFKKGSEMINSELAALKEDRQAFDALKKSIESIVSSAGDAGSAMAPQPLADNDDLAETLNEFRKGTETMGAELAALKEEVGSIRQIHKEIKGELQELLKAHFEDIDARLSQTAITEPPAAAKPKAAVAKKKGLLAAAIIEEEPVVRREDTILPDYAEEDDTQDDGALEFLSEDDILDVDKLRSVFQSVLDDSVSDSHNSRETDDDDSSADLLFLEDVTMEDEHEPAVTFSLDDESPVQKSKKDGKGKHK